MAHGVGEDGGSEHGCGSVWFGGGGVWGEGLRLRGGGEDEG